MVSGAKGLSPREFVHKGFRPFIAFIDAKH